MTTAACPSCGGTSVAHIVRGLVTDEVLGRDDVVIGGCLVDGREPDWTCRDCGHAWRAAPALLQWPDPRAHGSGEEVLASGRVGRVVLEPTSSGDVWADFELEIVERLPHLGCVAFPSTFAALHVAFEPGLTVEVTGRMAWTPGGTPELHVTRWLEVR